VYGTDIRSPFVSLDKNIYPTTLVFELAYSHHINQPTANRITKTVYEIELDDRRRTLENAKRMPRLAFFANKP